MLSIYLDLLLHTTPNYWIQLLLPELELLKIYILS